MSYICTTCDRIYDEIPPDAIQLTGGRGESRTITFTFPDGSYHSLRKLKTKKPKSPQTPAPEAKEDALQVPDTTRAGAGRNTRRVSG
jgi:hypothetical protein